jgi:hypothetical protein
MEMSVAALVGECGRTCNDWHQYLGLMSDLPHIMFEITLSIIQDGIIGILGYRAWKRWGKPRWIARHERRIALEHAKLDLEHGVSHDAA